MTENVPELLTVGIIQLGIGADRDVRFELLLPYYHGDTTYADLADGIAHRLNLQLTPPAAYVEVAELFFMNSDTGACSDDMHVSIAIVDVEDTNTKLCATIVGYDCDPDTAQALQHNFTDHMHVMMNSSFSSTVRVPVNIICDGRLHRTAANPADTVGAFIEELGIRDVLRIVDTTTGAAVCPSERCGHIFPLVAEVEVEPLPFVHAATSAHMAVAPVTVRASEDDLLTQPVMRVIMRATNDDDLPP
jgi:hypothetical protein